MVLAGTVSFSGAAEMPPEDPTFVRGYVSAVLEQAVGLEAQTYTVHLRDNLLRIEVDGATPTRLEHIREAMTPVAERLDLTLEVVARGEFAAVHYPHGDLFLPLLAYPKEPQFFMSWLEMLDAPERFSMGSVGLGETFGMFRWPDAEGRGGWQLDFFGAVFSQFNLDGDSLPLLNTDYQVGFPVSFRRDDLSGRFRLYHQSSHLGDELLLSGEAPERIDLSVEVIDGMLAYDLGPWRVYGGIGYMIHRSPGELDPWLADAGVDYRGRKPVRPEIRWVGGVHINSLEEGNWEASISAKLGVAIGRGGPQSRGTRIMLEYFDGPASFGQFYPYDLRYVGLGWYVNL